MKIVDRVQLNNENEDSYVTTFEIRGHIVNVFLDDYGQQYYLEYIDNNGELAEFGCGAYCFDFITQIAQLFDPKGYTISMYGEECWHNMIARGIVSDDYSDYSDYNFEALYKEVEGS